MHERIYSTEPLPINENLDIYAPKYSPENFTDNEKKFLGPFFTNIDKQIYVVKNLPEEVIGALSSKYSRSTKSLRRVFLDDYVEPTINPENQKGWEKKDNSDRKEALLLRNNFLEYVDYLNSKGGIEEVVNIQKGRGFFEKWLAEFGDDSIAEMGGIHVCIEGFSNIVVKEIEDTRIGISPIEKSSRYVSFSDKYPDGTYKYVVPGEIKGTEYEKPFVDFMNRLFDTYSHLENRYLDYIKELYPKGEDETEGSFNKSRSSKRFDDIRDLLPFSTQTNLAVFGNGRGIEHLINRLFGSEIGESRFVAREIFREVSKVTPSFISRAATERGAEVQIYKRNLNYVKEEIISNYPDLLENSQNRSSVELIDYDKNADTKIISAFLLRKSFGKNYEDIVKVISKLSVEEKTEILKIILDERNFGKEDPTQAEIKFRKPPRAFEIAHFTFSLIARGGDYRDLQRHRQQFQDRQDFNIERGFELEDDVLNSPFTDQFSFVLTKESIPDKLIELSKKNPKVFQYVVPFAYLQHWIMHLTARELYWIGELRTGSQGRTCYRKIAQEMVRKASEVNPALCSAIKVDWNVYGLARRESEKKIERKLEQLKNK